MTEDRITKQKIEKYIDITTRAIAKAKIIAPNPSYVKRMADDFMKMAKSYCSDALHFYSKGDYVNAFASVNYAHGWLDAGARLGLFDVCRDSRLFTLLE